VGSCSGALPRNKLRLTMLGYEIKRNPPAAVYHPRNKLWQLQHAIIAQVDCYFCSSLEFFCKWCQISPLSTLQGKNKIYIKYWPAPPEKQMTCGGAKNSSSIDGIFILGLGVKKSTFTTRLQVEKNQPTHIGGINAVNAPVDCYFVFSIPPVLVSDPIDTCEPQVFTLWHCPVASVALPSCVCCPAMLLLLHCLVATVASPVIIPGHIDTSW